MKVPPQTLSKIRRIEDELYSLIFDPVQDIALELSEYRGNHSNYSKDMTWRPFVPGDQWGQPWGSGWVRGQAELDPSFSGQEVFLQFDCGSVETLVQVGGTYQGLFNNVESEEGARSNHHTLRILEKGVAGQRLDILMQIYAGHPCMGTQPNENRERSDAAKYVKRFKQCGLYLKNEKIEKFVFDLRTIRLLSTSTSDVFVQGQAHDTLSRVFEAVDQHPARLSHEERCRQIDTVQPLLDRLIYEQQPSSLAPVAHIIGHSHMDTAWLWTSEETVRKCARTFSAALNMMERYPEYLFVQSSSIHTEMMRTHFPSIFEGMKERIAEGRWEPNGGMYVEADCNMPSGESLIRQFLKGQNYNKRHFDYRSDTFWLPDTFGYNAALPQIMRDCGIPYFCTTKLSWNDTNVFPYDSFRWRGIDQSEVVVHFNDTHGSPNPQNLNEKVYGGPGARNAIKHPDVTQSRLISFGIGDGGGGPDYDMLEEARRVTSLPGCPVARYTTVSAFMNELAENDALPVYKGELYLEGHRGTLTQMAAIKRFNRKIEVALKQWEMLLCFAGFTEGIVVDWPKEMAQLNEWWHGILLNQFHDILPGTSIPEEHDRALRDYQSTADQLVDRRDAFLSDMTTGADDCLSLVNLQAWPQRGIVKVVLPESVDDPGDGVNDDGLAVQTYQNVYGEQCLAIEEADIDGYGVQTVSLESRGQSEDASPFSYTDDCLDTPIYRVTFDEHGYLESLWDKAEEREVRGEGASLGCLWMGEDVPLKWDNWDIDYDQKKKMKLVGRLKDSSVISSGPLMFVLRQSYDLSPTSELVRDIVFYADDRRIEFDNVVQWKEEQQLLKVGFDVNVQSQTVRNEIQFGHVNRPTHENTSVDKAKFEVCNHRWSDLSESRYGVAVLNDCKYGISVSGSDMRLTLLKSGCRPDPRGDAGTHTFTFSLLPHPGGFSAESVVRPAYILNEPLLVLPGRADSQLSAPIVSVDEPNIIVEAIKPMEWDEDRGGDMDYTILRIYECEGSRTRSTIQFSDDVTSVESANMLEESGEEIEVEFGKIRLEFRPFEIKTLKIG